MYVIGTAGHVDHGKSTLVQALTGIDPDRLQEEKDRGLTIDLGFAWLTLPSGQEVSIVDVPGHERFIKNMLAGVGGIDLALLVVAADEGIMPQTREHVAILDLLGVERGVVALAKSDLAESEWLSLVEDEVEALLTPTTLAGSPVVPCSAKSGDGLDELVRAVEQALADTPTAPDQGRPRLPIDRVFTMSGFGTVVTGTLLDGSLKVGDEVEIVPGGPRARIRGLQNHKQKTDKALPGRRTAVNLAGIAATDVTRGMQLALPGTLNLSSLADVQLRVLEGSAIKHGARVMLHHFAAEVEARVSLLEEERLSGGEGWAQLRLATPLPLVRGDRFVLRAGGETLGGGQVVDVSVRRHRRRQDGVVERLSALAAGQTNEVIRLVEQHEPCTLGQVKERVSGLPELANLLADEVAAGRVVDCDGWLLTRGRHDSLRETANNALQAYHKRYPLRLGMPREELRGRLGLQPDVTSALLSAWSRQGDVKTTGAVVAFAGWEPSLTAQQKSELERFVTGLEVEPYAPAPPAVDGELAVVAEGAGRVVRVGDLYFSRRAYDEMRTRVVDAARSEPVTLAQVRDMFGTSRRYAQALLEHLDQQRITRRVGDARVLREQMAPQKAEPQGTEAS
jgi:selenocysteine-specific elongation factor